MFFPERYRTIPFLFGYLFAFIFLTFAVTSSLLLHNQKHQKLLMEKAILAMKQDNLRLEDSINKLNSNPETIEKAIRRLGMVKPNETLIVFQREPSNPPSSGVK